MKHELSGEKIKKELYFAIKEIGKEKIQEDITSSILSSQRYIDLLMNKCIGRLRRCFNPLEGLFSSKAHELITTYPTSMQSQLIGTVPKFFLRRTQQFKNVMKR